MVEATIHTKWEREIGSMRGGTEEVSFLSRVAGKGLMRSPCSSADLKEEPGEVERPQGGRIPGEFEA